MDDALELYTDGSGLDGRVGAGMVVLYHGQLVHSIEQRLPDTGTVFQAELVGIQMALDYCVSVRDGSLVHIYSDSRSALQSLADPRNTHEIANEIKRSIESLSNDRKTILLHWIKAHVGYPGNE
ncbi:hypothetical protein AVEN_219516-1 [Araneus ventricosus]|uniref:RNase H type-1 domain-containing protein n=1 Tax=Araneus ventricosus TaxID=182803 RepID=A0A4Y2BPQ1_ARAVE|nr:hypothetical protein AVEN_219516-1 [Araneus ventricosus]